MFNNNTAAPLNQNMNDKENEHLIAVTEKGDIKEKKEKEYEIQSDKKIDFKIEFFLKTELILIKAHKDINGIIVFYENSFDLKYIQKVKLFLGYDSLEACLTEIFPSIDEGKVELKEEDDILIFTVLLNSKLYPKIVFELNKRQKKDSEKIEEIEHLINFTKEELEKTLEKKLDEQKKIIESQNELIGKQSEKLEKYNKILEEQSKLISSLKNIMESLSREINKPNNNVKDNNNFSYHIMRSIKGYDCFSKQYFDSINQKCPKCRNNVVNDGTRNTASDDHTGISSYVYVINRNRIVYSQDCSTNNSVRNKLDETSNIIICGNIYICQNSYCKYSFAVLEK